MLAVVQCLETIVFHLVSGFLVISSRRVSPGEVTSSCLEVAVPMAFYNVRRMA